jgi:hypothetical protein
MRELYTWAAVLGAALLLVMSPGDVTLAQGSANQLAGSEWRPFEIRGEAVDANCIAFVRFWAE